MKKVDVLVVGAGPAGTACAIELLKAGKDCLLIDRAEFPREKFCGGGLTPKAWRLLDKIFPGLEYDYLPVDHMQLYMSGNYVGRYALDNEIRVVQRRVFDNRLLQEYLRKGGRFERNRLLAVEEPGKGRIVARLSGGESVECRYLVGADGSLSRVRKYLNPSTSRGALVFEQYCKKSDNDDIVIELSPEYNPGYFYVFPNKNEDVVGYGSFINGSNRWVESNKLLEDKIPESRLHGALLTIGFDYPQHDRILLVGDAGCWCDCLSGEGIFYAFATGLAASQAIITGKSFTETASWIFAKKRHHVAASKILYHRFTLSLIKCICRNTRLTERILNRYLR